MKGMLGVPVTEIRRLRRLQLGLDARTTAKLILVVVLVCSLVVVLVADMRRVLVVNVHMVAASVHVEVEARTRDGDPRHEQRQDERRKVPGP